MLPTVSSLCAALGADLAPVAGFEPPDEEITAVHISELLDPNAYLSGGELLLTTGLSLPSNRIGCRRYVARLMEAQVSALALGLGPVHRTPPEALVQASREAGLTLLTVPAPTPFLAVSRAYWSARSRATEQLLNDAVAAHRALVDAAVAPDPAAAILRRLARYLDGWAALLSTSGEVEQIFPVGLVDEAAALRAELQRLDVAGVHSSASFSSAHHVVVVFPLAVEDRIVGYLAAGSPGRVDAAQRRVILTAAALLSLDAVRTHESDSERETTRRCVAVLVSLGHAEAAAGLAAESGLPAPSGEVCVLTVRGRDSAELREAVERWSPDSLAVLVDGSTAWFLVPAAHPGVEQLDAGLRAADPGMAAVLTDLVPLAAAGPALARARRTLATMTPGQLVAPRATTEAAVRAAVDAFAARAGVDLQQALAAYLRHRGQWEPASQALELHRNTLRYRVGRAREVLGVDLDDPDVAAQVWLALRARGLA